MEPQSLILIQARCFYCGSQDEKITEIFPNFGILSCMEHYEYAKRDCNAYRHRSKLVSINDVLKRPELSPLLKLLEGGFHVLRSSGNLEHGWVVNTKTSCGVGTSISYSAEKGCWLLPVLRPSDGATKHINISELLIKEVSSELDSKLPEELTKFISKLDAGVYLEDALAHKCK